MSFVGFLDSMLLFLLNIRRETSNKALNAINELHLVPFLMSFLAARDRLPLAPVTSAGTCAQKGLLGWLTLSILKRNVFMSWQTTISLPFRMSELMRATSRLYFRLPVKWLPTLIHAPSLCQCLQLVRIIWFCLCYLNSSTLVCRNFAQYHSYTPTVWGLIAWYRQGSCVTSIIAYHLFSINRRHY